MSLKCVQFTNGMRLPIFSSNLYADYETATQVDTPSYEVTTYLMANAVIVAGDESGNFLNPDVVGLELEDLDGNTWKFTQPSSNVINLLITTPGGSYKSCDMVATRTGSNDLASEWILTCTGIDNEGNMLLTLCEVMGSIHMQRRLGSDQDYHYILGGYIEGWSGEYDFYNDIRRVQPVGTGRHDFGRTPTELHNIFKGNPFVNIQGLFLGGDNTVGYPEHYPSFDYYFSPFYAYNNRYSLDTITFNASIKDVDIEQPDPYEPGGPTGPGGGSGNLDDTSDDISIPSLPTLSAVDTGFVTLFNPTLTQLNNLASYMWGSLFDLDTFKKIFADPMDCIIGLSIVPVAVPNGSSKTVKVGNISTDVSMTTAASQYVEVNCGSINVMEYWGAYLDYAPYTQAEIYLPYIGTHPIDVDDIMGKTVTVVYHVDILSGACTAFVKCGGSVLYEFIGQCSSSIPITGRDWTDVINGVLSIAGNIGTMVATGGASAPSNITDIASTAVNIMKPSIEKSGSMSGTGGMMAVQTPYLILTRPKQAVPANQNRFTGYPSFITETLGSITGYTEIESIHLEGIFATSDELNEIESLLKGGVIL